MALLGRAGTLALAVAVPTSAQQVPVAAPLVFHGVTVVDVEQGKLVPDQRVVIAGNRIQTVGPSRTVRLPKGAQVVDARGKYLIPGLWDMHVHVGGYPQVFYPLFIANGVTGVRNMSSAFTTLDSLLKWRREIIAGVRVGPRVVLTGGYLGITPSTVQRVVDDDPLTEIAVTTPERAREAVDSLKAAGVDFIKVHDGLSREVYFAVASAARRVGLPLVGHFPGKTLTPSEVSDSGQRSIEHGMALHGCSVNSTEESCAALAARFVRNGTWRTPTFVVFRHFFGGTAPERLRFWPDTVHRVRMKGSFGPIVSEQTIGLMAKMRRAGMPFLAGTDATSVFSENTPGFSLHEELAVFVDLGMTPAEALRTATVNPAKFFGATDSLGTVAPGKSADLVLLDADPLVDINSTTKIRAVVANGRYFDRAALDQLLADVQAGAKQRL